MTGLAATPDWLRDLLVPKPKAQAALRGTALLAPPTSRIGAYAAAALRAELGALVRAPEGTRNNQLNAAAFSLGQLVGAGALDRSDVEAALEDAARAVGLSERETVGTIRSGVEAGMEKPRTLPDPARAAVRDLVDVVEPIIPPVANGHVNGHHAHPPEGTTPPGGGGGADDRPEIDALEGDLPVLARHAWAALATSNSPRPWLFRQSGAPVRIERDDTGAPVVTPMTPDRMVHALSRYARFVKRDVDKKTGEVSRRVVPPPLHVVKDVLATPDPALPVLARIVEAPVFGPGGELQTEPGYHAASRVYYAPPPGRAIPPVPARPTERQVAFARDVLVNHLLHDFPLVDAPDRAHAVGLVLEPFAREMIAGPVPFRLVEAPTPGSGKGLMVEVAAYPAVGRDTATLTQSESDSEWRKKITAVLRLGPSVVVLDNVTEPLDSGALASALTTPLWRDRVLGTNDTIALPVRCTWVATGNNVTMSTEIARRTVRIRLDPKMDRPWLRGEDAFRHRRLRLWAEKHRGLLVWSALTLIQAWVADGMRPYRGRPLGSFEHWSVVMGGILERIEIPGFLGNLTEFYESADIETSAWRDLVNAWWSRYGAQEVGTADLFPLAQTLDGFDLGGGGERAQRIVFGKQLVRQRDRIIDGRRVVATREKQRAQLWRLLPTDGSSVLL